MIRRLSTIAVIIFGVFVAAWAMHEPPPPATAEPVKPSPALARLVSDGRIGIEYGESVRVFVDGERIDEDALQTVYREVGPFEVCDRGGSTLGRYDGHLRRQE